MGVAQPVAHLTTGRVLEALRGYFAGVTAVAALLTSAITRISADLARARARASVAGEDDQQARTHVEQAIGHPVGRG